MNQSSKWSALLSQWSKDFHLWIFIVASLQLFRLSLTLIFYGRWSELTFLDFIPVVWVGWRFDAATAALWILLTWLLSWCVAFYPEFGTVVDRSRTRIGVLYVSIAVPLLVIDLFYFSIYNDHYNQTLFGIIHDDTTAILLTIWKSYHPILTLLAIGAGIYGGVRLFRYWMKHDVHWLARPARARSRMVRATVAVASVVLLVAVARGGTLWGRPLGIDGHKHAFASRNIAIDNAVPNPLTALIEAIKIEAKSSWYNKLADVWPSGDIALAAKVASNFRGGKSTGDIDAAITDSAPGYPVKPRHVFLIVLESQSGWTLFPEYRFAGLSPNLSTLADEGISFPNFVASGPMTFKSLSAALTGIPELGLAPVPEPTQRDYPTSIAAEFHKLGYKTRFFYGGYLGWQGLHKFAPALGFDESWGDNDMNAGRERNEWGVRDAKLYDFVLAHLDDTQPSFNVILTTSNHGPYDIDVASLGFPMHELPPPLVAAQPDAVLALGHLWYADREVGRFVRAAGTRLTKPLFALTGDHPDRVNLHFPGNGVRERCAVPFILYGPDVLGSSKGSRENGGSHIDIGPTLYGLVAPKGYAYRALGRDLLGNRSPDYAFGYQWIGNRDFLAREEEGGVCYPRVDAATCPPSEELEKARGYYKAVKALGWQLSYGASAGSGLNTTAQTSSK